MTKNLLLGFIAFALVACGQNEGGKAVGPQFDAKAPLAAKEYVFAIHPLNSPVRLFEIYEPLPAGAQRRADHDGGQDHGGGRRRGGMHKTLPGNAF